MNVAVVQRGNNNAYCQDEDWNWFDWSLSSRYGELLRFVKGMIAFRKANAALRQPEFLTGRDRVGSGYPDISWHGVQPWKPDWSLPSRSIAFMLCGRHGAAVGGPRTLSTAHLTCTSNPSTLLYRSCPRD